MAIRDDLPLALEPWLTADLQTYAEVIGEMFAGTEMWEGRGEDDGWSILLDPDRCPAIALPYLAQYVGETLPDGLVERDEALAREWIKDAPNQRRGTNYAIFRAAQRKLTGSRLVSIRNRDGQGPWAVVDDEFDSWTEIESTYATWADLMDDTDDPNSMLVATYEAETPDPSGTEADIRDVAPWDVDLTYEVRVGEDWSDVDDDYATWADIEAAFPTWNDVYVVLAGEPTFSRPRP
jgi:hypothetical protein